MSVGAILVLFSGLILLMGLPMFWPSRTMWLATFGTAVLLLGARGVSMRKGVG